jgi:hypothetical protein
VVQERLRYGLGNSEREKWVRAVRQEVRCWSFSLRVVERDAPDGRCLLLELKFRRKL